jgi:L-amino acid N-acyltransferase YncA
MIIRPVTAADLAAVADIYAHYVLHSTVSFEETPPSVEVMGERHAAVTGRGLPFLCAEIDGAVVGFAYAGPYGTRPAYRYTVEDSVYVASKFHSRGAGKALLTEIIARCEAADAGGDRGQRQRRLHRAAHRAGVQPCRHGQVGRLEARPLGRYRLDATRPERRRRLPA